MTSSSRQRRSAQLMAPRIPTIDGQLTNASKVLLMT
jgi:hypothetical protein